MDISSVIRASSRLEVVARKVKGESETMVIPRNVAILQLLCYPLTKWEKAFKEEIDLDKGDFLL